MGFLFIKSFLTRYLKTGFLNQTTTLIVQQSLKGVFQGHLLSILCMITGNPNNHRNRVLSPPVPLHSTTEEWRSLAERWYPLAASFNVYKNDGNRQVLPYLLSPLNWLPIITVSMFPHRYYHKRRSPR